METELLNQIERIKRKLILAKNADKDLQVFGADSHKYIVKETVNKDKILAFEKEYDVQLPEDYRAFLVHVGNGGISYENSAAGPGYGIFPFGENVDEFVSENAKKYLKEDCKLDLTMSDSFWEDLNRIIEENDEISNEDFYAELGKIFSGLLPIGTQGCTYYYALVLNGEWKGRIVNVDIERQKPFFVFESNFLDWYERWLDEIIPESTMAKEPDLFRYTLGGLSGYILEVYFSTEDKEVKMECLNGVLKKNTVGSEILTVLEEQYKVSSGEIQKTILQVLAKFDYERSKLYLLDFAKENLLAVFQFVFWYAKDKSADWIEVIKANADTIEDDETFRFCTYLLKETKLDYGEIIVPFMFNKSEEIRVSAYYALGQMGNKNKYLSVFIEGLQDSSNRVIHATLQALDGVEDKRLLKHYKAIAEKFLKEKDYILANLNHRLKAYGLTNKTIKKINTDFETDNQGKELY
ncbi:SMI1/KNR4 family protein [Flavobacterium lipolyticum]|uniref:SMI1/KNR4 family protein n=1 Tax=Flavobacterium lipolyticum TaxID=2893754 RepID=A0ABS8M3N7_9FLAO|nr:SMI1/KNR4 family protein [Flavobacterium sp. F-126]MCC9019440.1 SMI1/KNR4 family protein [Flavobacterium sp. F-126]